MHQFLQRLQQNPEKISSETVPETALQSLAIRFTPVMRLEVCNSRPKNVSKKLHPVTCTNPTVRRHHVLQIHLISVLFEDLPLQTTRLYPVEPRQTATLTTFGGGVRGVRKITAKRRSGILCRRLERTSTHHTRASSSFVAGFGSPGLATVGSVQSVSSTRSVSSCWFDPGRAHSVKSGSFFVFLLSHVPNWICSSCGVFVGRIRGLTTTTRAASRKDPRNPKRCPRRIQSNRP